MRDDGQCFVTGVSMVWVPVVTMLFWSPQVLAPHPEERALRSKYIQVLLDIVIFTSFYIVYSRFAIQFNVQWSI